MLARVRFRSRDEFSSKLSLHLLHTAAGPSLPPLFCGARREMLMCEE